MAYQNSLTSEEQNHIYNSYPSTVLDEDSNRGTQPQAIKTQLKYHQLNMIDYCKKLESTTKNPIKVNKITTEGTYNYEVSGRHGIIGDIVGSGKTLSVLGLIGDTKGTQLNNEAYDNYRDSVNNNFKVICVDYPRKVITELNTSLIVVPHTIFKQWNTTISQQTSLSFIPVNTAKTLASLRDRILKSKLKFYDVESEDDIVLNGPNSNSYKWIGDAIKDVDIILVSSTFYSKFLSEIEPFSNFKFKRIVFDEADSIKISGGYMLDSSFIWYVTSTYGVLLNPNGVRYWKNAQGEMSNQYSYSNGFIYSVRLNGMTSKGFIKQYLTSLSSHNKQYIKHFVVKNRDDFISNAFNLLPPIERVIKCKMPLSLRVLSNVASSELLSFINAGDIQGAVESLDCSKVSEEGLISAVTKDLQSKLDNKIIELEMKSKMSWSNEVAKKETLGKISNKIDELKQKISNIKEKLDDSSHCNICFDVDLECPAITPCCNTKFCFECITKWLVEKPSCPFCRASLGTSNIIVVDNKFKESENAKKKEAEEELDKLETLSRVIEDRMKETSGKVKMLIFTEYSRTFDMMGDILDSTGLKYSKVIGTTNTINKKVAEYKQTGAGAIDCLLLNAEYCASGLNLENTTDIVITHKMSKEKTTQIIGRGQRPGREGRLNVWKLYYQTEM
jgi:SNF2 family DNA or RNA helicase